MTFSEYSEYDRVHSRTTAISILFKEELTEFYTYIFTDPEPIDV